MTDDSDRGAVTAAIVVAGLLIAALAVTVVAVGGSLTAPSGEAILNETSDRYESADTVVGAATVTVSNETRNASYQLTFAATDDNESRVSVTGTNGTTVVGTNGSVAWVHDEATGLTRVVNESTAEPSALNESQNESARRAADRLRQVAFDWTAENTTATRVGTETIDGSETWVVEVESTNESRNGTVTYWIDQETSVVHKQRYTDRETTVTVRYTETRFDVALADSTFQPPGVQADRTQTVETFDALQDATSVSVPELGDAQFEEGYVASGGQTGVARYSEPNVSVVATAASVPVTADNTTRVELAGRTVNVTTRDGQTVVTWDGEETTVAVVAEDRETALAVAERLLTDRRERLAR